MSSKSFYAVANGRTKGIFTTWAECEKSVKDFPGAKFKKFTSESEAEGFVINGFASIVTNQNKSSSNIIKNLKKTFDSDSDSDSDIPLETKSKLKPIAKSKITNQIKTYQKTNTRVEEDAIRANINFDSETESETDSDTELDLKSLMMSLNSKTSLKTTYSTKLDESFIPDIIVYTDGACIANGQPNAKAGMGVYFGPDDIRNISKPVQGKQSNNTAELGALIAAYKVVEQDIKSGKKVAFFTDSVYSLLCLTTYGNKCDQNGWSKFIPNKELVKEAYKLFGSNKLSNIKLIHVPSHTGAQDAHSLGNEQADQLANLAIGMQPSTSSADPNIKISKQNNIFEKTIATVISTNDKKIYLKVSFDKKELAKKLGCRWDPECKKWYTNESNTKALEQFDGSI